MSIERAHRTVLALLRTLSRIPGATWLLRMLYATEDPRLEREVFGLKFRNPIGLAAGFDPTGDAVRGLAALGFGFIEVGTVTPLPQAGNRRPRIFRLPKDRAIAHRMGLRNRGLERTVANLRHYRGKAVIGVSIGHNHQTRPDLIAADYLRSFRALYQYADYFTVQMSDEESAQHDPARLTAQVMEVLTPLFEFRCGQDQYRPILLKVPADLPDETIDAMTDLMIATPLDGLVAVDGTLHHEGLQCTRRTCLQIQDARLSGQPLTERARTVVRRIYDRAQGTYPIIGVGGIMTPEDARAMLEAGASLVQLYTGYIYEGPQLLESTCRGLIDEKSEA